MVAIRGPVFWFLLGILVLSVSQLNGKRRRTCTPRNCKLPKCFCSGTATPKGLSAKAIPQMIMLSFDDAVNWRLFPFYKTLLNGTLKNPNGCSIGATFFVSHQYTQYHKLQMLYHQRHEIAVHTITHRYPNNWWKNASYGQLNNEIAGQREIIHKFGNVRLKDVRGFRAPFLQVGGNTQFKVLRDRKFAYDSSMPTRRYIDPPLWPYTMEYPSLQECMMPPCPTDSFPGLWEVPMVSYRDLKGHICSMVDACAPPSSEDDVMELLEKNFQRHYKSNRAPFPMFMHAVWFLRYPFALRAVKKFLEKKLALGDVWAVTISQALQWIRHPVPLKKIERFKPWKCKSPAPKVCISKNVNVCPYDKDKKLLPRFTVGVRHYLFTCTKPCSPSFPWYGNPKGN